MYKMKRMTAFLMSALLMGSAVYAPVMAAEIPADDTAEVSVIEEVPEAEESAEEAEIEVTEEPQVQQSSEEAMASGNRRNSFAEEGEYQTSYKLGDEVTLPVNVYNSSSSLTFEWAMGYCELNDENGPSEYNRVGNSTSSYTFTPDKIGVYYFRCMVGYGESWDYLSFAFDVLNHIIVEGADEDDVITVQANAGEDTVLEINAHAADGSALTYAWYDEEWNSIPAETSNRLTVRVEDSCEYYCEIAAQDGFTDYGDEPMTYTLIRIDVNVGGHKHTYGNWVVTKEATCTEDGSREKVCANCGDKITETIPAIGHAYGDWTVTTEPTCTEDGSQERICANCGDKETKTISATGHIWNDYYTRDVEPTETEEGSESIHCSVCNAINEETIRPIPVLVLKGTWKQDRNGWWYDRGNGTYPKDGFEEIEGVTYYFNASGYMKTGWVQDDGAWYYFAASGAMVKDNWQQSGSAWYYFGDDGKMVTGQKEINGTSYFFKDSGAMATGWQQIDGEWYYFAASGAMVKEGWQQSGSAWFYFGDDGKMVTGQKEINGTSYFFKDSGAMATGWQQIDGKWYYFEESGAMACSKWVGDYYLLDNGAMAINMWVDGSRYYVGADGKLISEYATTGWQKIGRFWYYYSNQGVMLTGFQTIGDAMYYFGSNGAMATSWQRIGDTWYYFEESGAMATGWKSINDAWYYFEESGAMACSKWIGDYYLLENGVMATNMWVDGSRYYVGADGKRIPNYAAAG